MTPRTFLPRHESLSPDVNDPLGFLMPSLNLCSGVTLWMLFITWLTCWTQSRIVYILIPQQDQIYSTGDWTHLQSQQWIIEQLTGICLPDCPPKSISTLPPTTLERSDANACGVLVLSFQSLKDDPDTGESFPPCGSYFRLIGTNVRESLTTGSHSCLWQRHVWSAIQDFMQDLCWGWKTSMG